MTRFLVNGLTWSFYYKLGPDALGFLPEQILATDMRPVREQLQERYAHGGGWKPFNGFKTNQIDTADRMVLSYPGDPPQRMLAECHHPNGEHIRLFESHWLMVQQKDGSYEISRVD